jgi:hypothetical protein
MSEAERAIMMEHAAYLRELAEKGKVLLFGPVDDPKGPWGLGLFETADEAELNDLLSADPTIRSRLGFRYEILPMIQAVLGHRLGGQ